MADAGATKPEPTLLIRIPEAARLLGISRAKLYAMALEGAVPGVVRLGRSVRISREVLLRWVADQTSK